MSGPKGIEYEIERSRREWQRLEELARRFAIRCEVSGHLDLRVEVPATPPGNMEAWLQSCAAFRDRLKSAQMEFDARRRAELDRTASHDLEAEVSALAREEAHHIAKAQEVAAASVTTDSPSPHAGSITQHELRARVDAELDRLLESNPELARLGASILGADLRRDRILLADLSDRVSAANKAVRSRRELENQIQDLRARAKWVAGFPGAPTVDPSAYLDRAEAHLTAGSDPRPDLRTASDLIAGMERYAERSAERDIVRSAVQDSLAELGYSVVNTAVATADTIHFRSTGVDTSGHLVRLGINDAEIDIRTVRTTESATRAEDMAADEAMCADLDGIVSGLERRGVKAGRIRRTEAGVVTPPVVAVRDEAGPAVKASSERRRRHRGTRTERGGLR